MGILGRLQRDQAGLTLIELMVAATTVAVTSITLLALFISIRNANNFARNETLSSLAATDEIEELRNGSFYSIPVGNGVIDFSADLPADLPDPKTGIVDVTEINDQLKQIDIEIAYRQGPETRSFKYTTFISIPGLTQ